MNALPFRPLASRALAARRRLLRMHHESGVGHIGGNLSSLDAMLHLHASVMGPSDVFVLSKGHAAGALYVTLWSVGLLSDAALAGFHRDGTRLAGHPSAGWHDRIPFSTGSLGHGLGLAAGVALGKRLRAEEGRVFCLLSEGDCQEGSTWEAVAFARHHGLSQLVVLVDANGLQGFGTTAEVCAPSSLGDQFRGLGLTVSEVDGHCERSLDAALRPARTGPHAVVLRTVKGRGVSFMEGRMEWHYLPLTPDQYRQAVDELDELEYAASSLSRTGWDVPGDPASLPDRIERGPVGHATETRSALPRGTPALAELVVQ